MKPKLTSAATMILLLIVSCSVSAPSNAAQPRQQTDATFKFQDLEGRVNDLRDLRGNVVLVSFGATWCTPCSTELSALQQVLKEYSGKPIKFFWVSIEAPEQVTNAALKRYAKQRGVTFPVLRDSSQAVFLQFSPRVRLPMIVFLSKDGRVDTPVQFGMRSPVDAYKTDIRTRLNKLLSEPSEGSR